MLESLGAAKIGIFGLGSVALFGGIMLLLKRFIQKDDQKKDIEVAKHEGKQEQIQDQIKEITKEQAVLVKQIEVSKKASQKSREKVEKIAQKAAVEMHKVLSHDDIVKTDKMIDDEWEDL